MERQSFIGQSSAFLDAVELAGYAETQQCKLGAQFSSLLLQTPTRIVCPTPSHRDTPLVLHGTSTHGATRGRRGYFYPLYLLPPDEPYHAHGFIEVPGVRFFMPDANSHHAEAGIEPADARGLIEFVHGATRSLYVAALHDATALHDGGVTARAPSPARLPPPTARVGGRDGYGCGTPGGDDDGHDDARARRDAIASAGSVRGARVRPTRRLRDRGPRGS